MKKALEKPKGARFSDEQLEYIIALIDEGYSMAKIAARIGSSRQAIAKAVTLYDKRKDTAPLKAPKPAPETELKDGGPWYESICL